MTNQIYFVGLGSNVDARRNVARALDQLLTWFGAVQVSHVAETAPVAVAGGTFLNMVASFQSELPAREIKGLFCAFEEELGRDRSHPNCAKRERSIDLDILFQLPTDAWEVNEANVPTECYYRAATVELIALMDLSCAVPAVPITSAIALDFLGNTIGLHPARLHRDRSGAFIVSRQRRAALVTGGGVRVGRAIALTLAGSGYDVAIHYNTSLKKAEQTAVECRAKGVRCEVFRGDFLDVGCLPGLMEDVANRFPHLELLVNSASAYEGGDISQTTPELLDRQWCINFKAPFLLMREFATRACRGAIINVLDNKIAFSQFQYAAYLTAKKALGEATRMAALEFAPRIRVNGLSPGVILPASTRDQAYLDWRRAGIPAGRLGNPEQLCEALLLLAGNPFITGQILAVDGGESAGVAGRNARNFHNVQGQLSSADMEAA